MLVKELSFMLLGVNKLKEFLVERQSQGENRGHTPLSSKDSYEREVDDSIKLEVCSSLNTPLQKIREDQKVFFTQQNTKPIEFRLAQLAKLEMMIRQNEEAIKECLKKDLGKPETEAYLSEVAFVLEEITFAKKNLRKWMAPQKIPASVNVAPAKCQVQSEPLGEVLIIAPWNYPFQLTLGPLVGAIAAGNTVVLKPSEISTHTTQLICDLMRKNFLEDYIAVFTGGPHVSKALLEKPWGHVFFTGSTQVGRQVSMACGAHLTPVTLELGGKSPCIIDETASISVAAKRIIWGKFLNAGQTCIAPDYVLVHESKKEAFVAEAKAKIVSFYGENPQKSGDYSRIINAKQFDRLIALTKDAHILAGGESDKEALYISPTLLDGVSLSHPIMQEEIFGPLLPILTFDKIEEAIGMVRERQKPLALYLFSESKERQKSVFESLSFGGGCINDTIMHCVNIKMPFGGVGQSGTGASHGKHSFDTFSHVKSLLSNTTAIDLPLRYPPHPTWKQKLFRLLMG